jgi:hypothetical protein
LFQSTPARRASRRQSTLPRDIACYRTAFAATDFNPRSRAGTTISSGKTSSSRFQSTAPPAGATPRSNQAARRFAFQSTPPRGERRPSAWFAVTTVEFQSTLPLGERSTTSYQTERKANQAVARNAGRRGTAEIADELKTATMKEDWSRLHESGGPPWDAGDSRETARAAQKTNGPRRSKNWLAPFDATLTIGAKTMEAGASSARSDR